MKPIDIKAGICTVAATVAVATALGAAGVFVPAATSAAPVSPDMATKLVGRTVFLDPGHQGSAHGEDLARQVDDGRGGTKDCQTTGMTTLNGVPEHTVNWNVAQLVKTSLESLGARVVLSRQDDTGWGGCIDERARAANESGAAVAVSIHADSAPAAAHGFHLIVPQLPVPDAVADRVQATQGLAATTAVRDAYLQAGFTPADYAGVRDGLQTRADIAGPALTRVPDVFIEMGNGANPQDAAVLESADGQLRHAIAITTGLVGYLLSANPAASPGDSGSADRPAAAPTTTSAPTTTAPTTTGAATTPPAAAPQYRTAPGTTVPGATTPSTPGTDSEAAEGPLAAIVELLRPLVEALGLDETAVTAELVDLAYALIAPLIGPGNGEIGSR